MYGYSEYHYPDESLHGVNAQLESDMRARMNGHTGQEVRRWSHAWNDKCK